MHCPVRLDASHVYNFKPEFAAQSSFKSQRDLGQE